MPNHSNHKILKPQQKTKWPMDLLLAGPKANGWQNRVEKTDAPLPSSEAKKPDHQSQKV